MRLAELFGVLAMSFIVLLMLAGPLAIFLFGALLPLLLPLLFVASIVAAGLTNMWWWIERKLDSL